MPWGLIISGLISAGGAYSSSKKAKDAQSAANADTKAQAASYRDKALEDLFAAVPMLHKSFGRQERTLMQNQNEITSGYGQALRALSGMTRSAAGTLRRGERLETRQLDSILGQTGFLNSTMRLQGRQAIRASSKHALVDIASREQAGRAQLLQSRTAALAANRAGLASVQGQRGLALADLQRQRAAVWLQQPVFASSVQGSPYGAAAAAFGSAIAGVDWGSLFAGSDQPTTAGATATAESTTGTGDYQFT